jgi:Flp pilus assembly protein protease CpaA
MFPLYVLLTLALMSAVLGSMVTVLVLNLRRLWADALAAAYAEGFTAASLPFLSRSGE